MRIWLAEFIGTFALVFAGIGTLAAGGSSLAVSLAFGLAVAVMISAVGNVSAAHFNPAVTLGFVMMGLLSRGRVWLYVSAELAGALVAMLLLLLTYGRDRLTAVNFGVTQRAESMSLAAAFTVEAVLTFFLMFVIATAVIQKSPSAGLYIGLTVTLGALAGGALTGASMNPARSLAPALVANIWSDQWLYWLAPGVGSSLAAVCARYVWQGSVKRHSTGH